MEGGAGGGGPTAHTSGSRRPCPQHCVAEGAPPHGLRHRDPHRPTREEGRRPRAPQQPPTAALPQSPHRIQRAFLRQNCQDTPPAVQRRPGPPGPRQAPPPAPGLGLRSRCLRSRVRPVQPHSLAKSLWATEQHTVTNPTGLRPAPLANLGCGDLVRQDGQPCSARAWARPSGCPPAPR